MDSSDWDLGSRSFASLKLVFAFAVKATQHAQFVRDFTLLEKRLYADASEKTVKAVNQERLDLEALEPPRHAGARRALPQ